MDKTQVAKLYDMKVKAADNYCLQKAFNSQIDLFQDKESILREDKKITVEEEKGGGRQTTAGL